jgi:predicted GNAT family N-acyltransferase
MPNAYDWNTPMDGKQRSARPPVVVREVDAPTDMEAIYRIRDEVFVAEQALTPNARNDPDDERSIHYLAEYGSDPVGTGRLTMFGDEAQIAWVAVKKSHRGEGIGWRIMEVMIERSEQDGGAYIILNAQTHALEFYERLGFRSVGRIFTMANIPHQVMIRQITAGGGDTVRRYLQSFGER